jgi:hypothetical protein
MMADNNQRRRNARFPVQQKLVAATNSTQLVGTCRDVNAEGVFFFTSTAIEEGSRVDLRLNLPPGTIFSDEVSLRASGNAIRVEDHTADGGFGVAVAFDQVEIHHSPNRAVSG